MKRRVGSFQSSNKRCIVFLGIVYFCTCGNKDISHLHLRSKNIESLDISPALDTIFAYTRMTMLIPSPRASRMQQARHVLSTRPMTAWNPFSAHQALASN